MEKEEKSPAELRMEKLCAEALALPETPGVYLMHDAADRVIYVGKSRCLRNRVSQYFHQGGSKNYKTLRMVASVARFEVIHCDTEIEALTLENTLIKQYTPRYNIRLKDAKSYPYIKFTPGEYPRLVMTRKRTEDGGRYFGPYSGTSTVFSVISTVNKAFGLPTCRRRFPEEIGKGRPCLYYQIGQCSGVCTGAVSAEAYAAAVADASDVLRGNSARVRRQLEEKMLRLAEEEQYEAAAVCRDTIASLEKLTQKQKAVASPDTNQDVIGVYTDDLGGVMCLLRIRGGVLNDKLDFRLSGDTIADSQAYTSMLYEHYRMAEDVPERVLIGFDIDPDDRELLSLLLGDIAGKKVPVHVPERGDTKKLCLMAAENARQTALKYKRETDGSDAAAIRLAELLSLEVVPDRIESYDISNIGSEHITAGMIVTEGGKFNKRDYRTFTIKSTDGIDDYGAMREVLTRRLSYLLPDSGKSDAGSYAIAPDLILLDGGAQHLAVAEDVMEELGVWVPVAGMVKDDYHKTRALVTPEGEVSIAREHDVFVFIYKIQEEVHRFTVSRMSAAKRKTVRTSVLEKVDGIGPKKAKAILAHFGGLARVRTATADELVCVRGVTRANAEAIEKYFKMKNEK